MALTRVSILEQKMKARSSVFCNSLYFLLCGCYCLIQVGCCEENRILAKDELHHSSLLGFNNVPLDERRIIAKNIATNKSNWSTVWILLSRGEVVYFEGHQVYIDDCVPLILVYDIIESAPLDINEEVCYQIIKWLDEDSGGRYSTYEKSGLRTIRKDNITRPIQEVAKEYLTRRYGVDHQTDMDAWREYIKNRESLSN